MRTRDRGRTDDVGRRGGREDDDGGRGERIRQGVDALEFPRQPPLRCSVSIGIAEPPAGDAGLRGWMEAADQALYRAKAAGRNRVAARPDLPALAEP